MRSLLLIAAAVAAVASTTLFATSSASAAPNTSLAIINASSLPRLDSAGAPVTKRDLAMNPEGINRADCEADQRIAFPLTMAGFEVNAVVEVWAALDGADCSSAHAREGANAQCWPLQKPVALTANQVLSIPVRDILHGGGGSCGTLDRTKIAVQFLYFEPGQNDVPSVRTTIVIDADTIGPPAPTNLRINEFVDRPAVIASVDDLRSSHPSERLAPLVDDIGNRFTVVHFYAAPATSTCALDAFGPTPIAVNDAFEAQFAAGSTLEGNAPTTTIEDAPKTGAFTADTRYTFAAAGFDSFGNASALSAPACATLSSSSSNAANAAGDDDTNAFGCSMRGRKSASESASESTSTIAALMIALGVISRRRRPPTT